MHSTCHLSFLFLLLSRYGVMGYKEFCSFLFFFVLFVGFRVLSASTEANLPSNFLSFLRSCSKPKRKRKSGFSFPLTLLTLPPSNWRAFLPLSSWSGRFLSLYYINTQSLVPPHAVIFQLSIIQHFLLLLLLYSFTIDYFRHCHYNPFSRFCFSLLHFFC